MIFAFGEALTLIFGGHIFLASEGWDNLLRRGLRGFARKKNNIPWTTLLGGDQNWSPGLVGDRREKKFSPDYRRKRGRTLMERALKKGATTEGDSLSPWRSSMWEGKI